MYGNRVVVTGLGAITPIGLSADEYWQNLKAGVSGVDRIRAFDPTGLPVQIAAEVKGFDPGDFMDRKAAKRLARFSQFAVASAGQALHEAGIVIDQTNAWDVGAVIATGGGGVGEVAVETETLLTRGPDRVGPMLVPLMIANMASCQVSMVYGIKGPVTTSVAACAAGVYALFEALHFLRRGDAKVIVAGGTESAIMPIGFLSLGRAGALSRRNEEPRKASRPFDKDRDGFVFGEGAGALVLETLDHARRRGARILAELAGASITADAYHVSAPEPSGESPRRAMLKAIADADLRPEDVDYICAHGTGTPLNDISETRAIKLALGDHAHRIPVSSVKSMVGHLLGAAGAMSALACVNALQEGCLPPTINLDTPDPECDLDYVPWNSRQVPIRTAMVHGFGFGGQNSVAIFKKWEEG
jgi:3-oxoacyl-[acyl-carrier-protein] synthase II